MQYLIVFLGGGLGTLGRHGVNMLAARLVGTAYPFGTFAINVLGSFAMGLVTGFLATRLDLSPSVRLFLTTGILGGFTTFSTFSLETALLIERGEHGAAAIYVLASVLVAIPALFAGLAIARSMGGA